MSKMINLEETLKTNSKERMLLLYAVSNNCYNAIRLSVKDEYAAELLCAAVENWVTEHTDIADEFNSSLLDETSKMVISVIGNEISEEKSKSRKLVQLERALKKARTQAFDELIASIPEELDVSGIDKISVSDIDSTILWMVVGWTLSQIDICKTSMVASTKYTSKKKKSEKNSGKNNMTSDFIQQLLVELPTKKYKTVDFEQLNQKTVNVLKGIYSLLEREAENAKLSMITHELKNTELEELAKQLSSELSEMVATPNMLPLVREYVTEADNIVVNVALCSILYSETILLVSESLSVESNPIKALYDELRFPGFSSLVRSTDCDELDTELLIKEYEHKVAMKAIRKDVETRPAVIQCPTITSSDTNSGNSETGENTQNHKKVATGTSSLNKLRTVATKVPVSDTTKSLSSYNPDNMSWVKRQREKRRNRKSETPSVIRSMMLSRKY